MQEKEIVKLMPKFYRWNALNMSMFFFIKAQMQLFPTLTIDQAISNYYKFMDMDEGEWDRMSMRTQYGRMQCEFFNDQRSECTQKDSRTAKS